MTAVDVLIPTCNRPVALAMTLAGLAAQTHRDLRVVVADQSDEPVVHVPTIASLMRVVEARHGTVVYHHRPPLHGIAEQRDFLLHQAGSEFALYLDDDVFMEPWVVKRMAEVLRDQGCGFVGAFPAGLSFVQDVRPDQQRIEFWDGPVEPEVVEPDSPKWQRLHLHRAANLYHVTRRLAPRRLRLYKVAWVASCILYHRQKLLAVGGFSFWRRLPRYHSGEEVLVQNLLMRRWGGCAMMPSGTYHAEEASTVLNPAGTVDGHALDLLPEMVARYVQGDAGRAYG